MKLTPLRPESNELLHLDAMRFVAAAGIVLQHSKELFFSPANRVVVHSPGLGLFVDLFFVISGYVIAHVYADRIHDAGDFGRFIQRRIGRLVPLHWLTFAVGAGIWGVLAQVQTSSSHLPSFKPSCLIETFTLTHAIFSCDETLINGQSWSISAEMVLYVLFPVFLWIGRRSSILLLILVAGATAADIGSHYESLKAANSVDIWGDAYAPLRGAVSFCVGIIFWLKRSAIARFPAPEMALALSLPALCFVMQATTNVVLTMILIYMVVFAAIASDLKGKCAWPVRAIAPLGQLTYSIYMWHGLVILVLMNIVGDKILHATGAAMGAIAFLTYLVILLCSYVSFVYFETPARRWIDRLKLLPSAPSFLKSSAK